ncbi:TonB-dependent receptor [bacterium]|nr:TonB-dependent receptor [bacterium]
MRPLFTALLFFTLIISSVHAQESAHGSIHGSVVDTRSGQPLAGANVYLPDAQRGAASDADGKFRIEDIPAGSYRVRVSAIGYETLMQTDVIVRPSRGTELVLRLREAVFETGEVEITADYFRQSEESSVSAAQFSGEEIRRAPGSAGDVSRIMMVLPSVAKVNDQSNSLIVRGGSPLENAFFVDGIEVPNINHFPAQGASGGPLGMLPVDMIREVNFIAGGFPVRWGDRLSSVMDISFREGSRDALEAQADLNFVGFGGLVEGPLGADGSWLLSVRRSYLDLIVSAIDIGTSVAPWYGDASFKLAYDISPKHRVSLLALWSDDHNDPDAETAAENDMQYFGRQDIYNATSGITWRALWGKDTWSESSVSWTGMRFREHFLKTGSEALLLDNRSDEHWISLRTRTQHRFSREFSIEAGADAKLLRNSYDNTYGGVPDVLGGSQSVIRARGDADGSLSGIYATLQLTPIERLDVSLGLRAQHNSINESTTLEPRASAVLQLTQRWTLSASGGLYTQSLPLLLLSQNPAHRNLPDPRALHGVLGTSYLLTASTRVSLEGYLKKYDRFPVDPAAPGLFVVDEMSYRYGFFSAHEHLVPEGKAFSRGLELTVQKKLAEDFYGMASAGWSTARYTGLDGIERDRAYDNRLLFSIEGGYKPSAEWECSLRWIYAGGVPYTPIDLEASIAARQEVLDPTRINALRHPDYHSMNIRIDRRFNFSRSSLTAYISIWNLYDRRNIAAHIYDDENKSIKTLYQWGLLPIFGIEWEI